MQNMLNRRGSIDSASDQPLTVGGEPNCRGYHPNEGAEHHDGMGGQGVFHGRRGDRETHFTRSASQRQEGYILPMPSVKHNVSEKVAQVAFLIL